MLCINFIQGFSVMTVLQVLTKAYELYDPVKELCCNGTVHSRNSGVRCCGSSAYHPRDYVCCFGSLLPSPSPMAMYGCCGNRDHPQLYRFGQSECCLGHLVDLPDESGSNTYYGCCGNELYFPDAHTTCCNGRVRHVVDVNETCCGSDVIDENKNICCQIREKRNGTTTLRSASLPLPSKKNKSECCGLEIYDSEREICCGGEVHLRNTTTTWCCGASNLYDASVDTCCRGKVHKKKPGYECCWTAAELYNPETEMCCEQEVVPKTPEIQGREKGFTACCAPKSSLKVW